MFEKVSGPLIYHWVTYYTYIHNTYYTGQREIRQVISRVVSVFSRVEGE